MENAPDARERFVDGPVVVFTWRNEPGWPVEYVSPNVERLFGYAPAELYAADPPYAELIHDDDLDRVRAEVERHSDGTAERFHHEPYRMVTDDGEVRWVLDYTHVVREGGDITHYTGYIVDITERKEQAVRLEQAESIGGFGSWRWALDTDDVWWSETVYEIFERSLADGPLGPDEVLETVHPADRGRLEGELETTLLDGDDYDTEYRICVDGRTKWLRGRARVTTGPAGEPKTAIGVVKDITTQKRRERTLRARAEQLEYVNALNATIRSLHGALIDADSRSEIRRDVCEALAGLEGFDGAWIGAVDPSTEEVVPAARARVPTSLLEARTLSLDAADESAAPAVEVVRDRTPAEASLEADPDRAYGSALAIPISHRGMLYGALTVYGRGDAFDDRISDVLVELGALVGYAITAVERRNALHGEGTRDLVLAVTIPEDDPLRALAARLSEVVEVRSVSQRKHGEALLHCLIDDADPEAAAEAASGIPGIRSIEPISADAAIYEIVVADRCAASTVTALGVRLRSMRVAERECELAVAVRRGRDRRRFLTQVAELLGDAELKADREAGAAESLPWPAILNSVLTDQQENVLTTAYHSGYFDANRKQSGAEIAESLGISQPTFATHMRAAQRNLLSAIHDATDEA